MQIPNITQSNKLILDYSKNVKVNTVFKYRMNNFIIFLLSLQKIWKYTSREQ